MAYRISIPFYSFKLHLPAGLQLSIPMTDKEVLFIGQPLHLIAGKYAEVLQREVLNKGNFRQLLDEFRPGEFFKDHLSIDFPADKDRLLYPAFSITFDYFFNRQAGGFWGIVPSLGVESYARDLGQLKAHLIEAIRLDFARHRRLTAVQHIVSSMWVEVQELLQYEIELSLPSPREVNELQDNQQDQWLPMVAQRLEIDRRVLYGRRQELEQIAQVLKNNFSRNVLLVGPSGVGKTTLIWEISRQLAKRRIKGVIWETTASTLIKELTRETGWQDNIAFLCKELAQTGDLLFIRNLMELFEVGRYEGNTLSIADYLRSYLSRGEITLISECTEEEMARIELKSPHYLAMFQIIRIEEPREELEQIILKKVQAIAQDKRIRISEEAIREVIRLNRRYMPYSGLPGKPIRFLESMLIHKKNEESDTEGPLVLEISKSEVVRHFSEESGMPQFMIGADIPMHVPSIRAKFHQQVFGQEDAVNAVVDLLASVKTALTRSGKPIASFLFLGPTGVGKTQLAKVLAEFMFGSKDRLTRFDMSEFSTSYGVMRLIGTDYFTEGLLTSAIRREPFSVLLFDEVEKAHPNFFDLLLQVLSEGRLTDNQGKLVNFCSTIIIMTSNLGAERLQSRRISWNKDLSEGDVREHFIAAARRAFRPELFNRIDQIIPFFPLDQLTIRHVVDREINLLRQREGVKFRRMDLHIEEEVLDYLGQRGYDSKYGARHLQRAIREDLIIPLSRALNGEDFDDQLQVQVFMADGKLQIEVNADPLGLELLIEELDKIRNADHAGNIRRQIRRLMEGPVYVRLLNELALLEGGKSRKGKKIWSDPQKAETYAHFLQIKTKVEQMAASIEHFENELCLASLGQIVYNPVLLEQLETWEEAFFELKMEMFSRLNPTANQCFIGLYGSHLQEITRFYTALCERRKYQYTMEAVWFRESLDPETGLIAGGAPESPAAHKKHRGGFVKSEWKPESTGDLPSPLQGGDLWCGVELTISGPAAFLFFVEERGGQRWRWSEYENFLYVVEVEKAPTPTPEKIHRKEFFQRHPPRRIIEQDMFKDTIYRINRDLKVADLEDFMADQLEQRFRIKLDMEVL